MPAWQAAMTGASPEHARINPDNPFILVNHLKCGAFELPFAIFIMKGFFDAVPWDIEMSALTDGAASTVYNLGNGLPTSVRQVLDAVERVTGRSVPYTKGPRRPGDPAVLYASSDRISSPP